MIAYKFLRRDGTSGFTGFRWPLPDGEPGPWVDAQVDPCRSGVHACGMSELPYWVGPALYEIELEGEVVEHRSKLVAPRGRLVQRVDGWDEELRGDYTRMCADRAHEIASSVSPRLDEWDALLAPSVREGPALLGFMAARIAEEVRGPDAYRRERERQATWLVERLGLGA